MNLEVFFSSVHEKYFLYCPGVNRKALLKMHFRIFERNLLPQVISVIMDITDLIFVESHFHQISILYAGAKGECGFGYVSVWVRVGSCVGVGRVQDPPAGLASTGWRRKSVA